MGEPDANQCAVSGHHKNKVAMLRILSLVSTGPQPVSTIASLDLRKLAVPKGCERVDALGKVWEGEACPSQPAVQEAWIEAVREAALACQESRIELNGLGFQGAGRFFDSICFCPACQYGYGAAGGIVEQLARENWTTAAAVDHPSVNTVLLWRRSVQYGLLEQMRVAVEVPLCLRTAAQLKYTGDRSSLTFDQAQRQVSACSVDVRLSSEFSALSRPLPVLGIVPGDELWTDHQHRMFSGYILESV